ncbi:SDR family oxidoreductase [Kribbella sandramycini]|uniref:NAD(P)-dependent dehydrogenase (Short-subunit alcohol dehydrogenase family) n=1 Tax=Kribbella sandramycini TaxID=60450 RepID=A0A7Y4L4F1_9ACTN|nr:SDR family oxidoreductase [Kribbella sandramycini]MBB6571541.1 NAD(P)-dependent dehydrogenase (short-subunit alcohol dehydrogenase family) [Kribbella sandramycini]NOL44190.1 SDR family oxidoreductase [Kribbella sandramycini]
MRTALVTGASRGIGRAIALRLARDGIRVGVHYGRNDAAARRTVGEIEAAGGQAFALKADLGDPVEALWAAYDEVADGLDILVNNAAIGKHQPLAEVTPEWFDRLFAVNAKAPFFLVQQAVPRLRDGGRIINIGSGVTRIAFPQDTAYSMTKGALQTLTLALAKELGPRRITVNTVAPGIIDTEMNDWLADPEAARAAAAYSVFDQIGQPAEVADVVAFVASDDARWVTGQTVDATGGSQL